MLHTGEETWSATIGVFAGVMAFFLAYFIALFAIFVVSPAALQFSSTDLRSPKAECSVWLPLLRRKVIWRWSRTFRSRDACQDEGRH